MSDVPRRAVVRNTAANLAGQLLPPLLSLILVPVYIRYLGLEGYGLIGFFAVLVTLLSVFTQGIGWSFQREVARRHGSPTTRATLPGLLRTFEIAYWVVGAGLALVLVAAAGWISRHWIDIASLAPSTVHACLMLAGIRVALALPTSIYLGLLTALERQVLTNSVMGGFGIAGGLIQLAVVMLGRSVIGYFLADVVLAIAVMLVLRFWSRRSLGAGETPHGAAPVFDAIELRALLGASLGLIVVHGIGVIIKQVDRLVISVLLPVSSLGLYSAGTAGGRVVSLAYGPYLTAVYPETCRLAREADSSRFVDHLVRNATVITILSLAIALPMAFFAPEILAVWIRNARVTSEASTIMALFAFGSLFLAVANVFYQGQVAQEHTRFSVAFNACALGWYPVATWLLVRSYGITGAAVAWLLYCVLSWAGFAIFTFVVLLKGRGLAAWLRMTAMTAALTGLVTYAARTVATQQLADHVPGRLLVGVLSGVVSLLISYLLCFGPRAPRLR